MRKSFALLLILFIYSNLHAQVLDPVKWRTRIEKLSDNEFNLIFEGTIEPEWHVYSQFTPENGPLPLEILFENTKGITAVGKAKESAYKKKFNEVFEVDEYYFEKKFTITQKVNVTTAKNIAVSLNYQVCKEVCINQEKTFTFTIPQIPKKTSEVLPDVIDTTSIDSTIITTPNEQTNEPATKVKSAGATGAVPSSDRGFLSIFIFAFISGFAALLTPCVFPMIPMTVSFFTKQSRNRAAGIKNAIIYGVSIILIYVALGSVVTAIFGADALNALSTNVWFNLIFFVILIIFALSFLGAFEIMLPNSWANKVDRQADKGGIIGILFMALALAIVSFSCTGPIVGTLLVEAASKGGMAPVIGMLGFSLALALPFMLFAMFPGWLNTLPKSGGWLNTVKVFLGFLELALAFKFLSNADLVLQLHLLERELFLAIWIAIFGALALYLLGKISLPHDSQLPFISTGRLSLGLIVTAFTLYLIPGLWGAPLKVISGFPPPLMYSESPYGVGSSKGSDLETVFPDGAKFGPHDIVAFEDYEKGLAYAKSVGKPALVDFTGYACVNCRKMEDYVWSDERVLSILKNEIVLISLYVDDKRELPEDQKYVSKETGKKIKSIGNKWSDFQITRYKSNTQPLYVLIDGEENMLVESISYTPNINEYKEWLQSGINNYKQKK
ncbi:MAG TPA: cytochrome c biogenesis protein CcdA [Flavobacterium sp.]